MPRDQSVPRLANDSSRAWLASAFGVAGSFAVGLGYIAYLRANDLEYEQLTATTVSGLTGVLGIFVAYEILTWRTFRRASAAELSAWLGETTPRQTRAKVLQALSGGGATSWSAQAAVFALLAVIVVSFVAELRDNPLVVSLGLALVIASWLLVVCAYAVSYARENIDSPGLEFPGDTAPTWSDYVYLAVQVSTTFSSSDVTVLTTAMRRHVAVHSVLAFVFNTVIVALLVSALLTFATT